ncbi:MAG: hypothetical protein ABJA81_01945 [Nocardioidaceae bacterium]
MPKAPLALLLVPLSTSSGENLEHQVADTSAIDHHAQFADGLLPWVIAMAVATAAVVWWDHRSARRPRSDGSDPKTRLMAVAAWSDAGTSVSAPKSAAASL